MGFTLSSSIGVCIFDDAQLPAGGWASISGEESVRIRGIPDLRSDILWVTNLDYKTIKKLRLYNSNNISDSQFFRTAVDMIAKENGSFDKKEQASIVSNIFDRVVAYSKMLFNVGVESSGYRFYTHIADKVMPLSAKRRPQGSVDTLDLIEGIRQSCQILQKMNGSTTKGSSATNFVFPRGAYFGWLLGLKYPGGGEWKELSKKSYSATFGHDSGRMISGTKAVLEKLTSLGDTNAAIFRVVIHSQSVFHSPYQSFGHGSDFIRRWATLPEILHLSRFSKIEIFGGYYTPLEPLSISSIIQQDTREFSYSRGVVLENLFVALASPIYGSNEKTSALGAYMRSYDRIACARAAEVMVDQGGYIIGSFGVGRVTLFLRPTEIEAASALAFSAGLIPPIKQKSNDG